MTIGDLKSKGIADHFVSNSFYGFNSEIFYNNVLCLRDDHTASILQLTSILIIILLLYRVNLFLPIKIII